MLVPICKKTEYQLLIIIGAARSGTNMLRDVLAQLPGFATWPCDEINYMWRHHWASWPNDELQPRHATARVRRYLHTAFAKQAGRTGAKWLVEKTCANSLRVEYVRAVFPDAKFIFLVRDGRDAIASALKRWTAKPEVTYLAKKARQVPMGDVPYYAARHLAHRLHQLTSAERRLGSWGPRFEGIDEMLKTRPLIDVCAEQWRRCVARSMEAFAEAPFEQVCHLRYESFVNTPRHELERVLDYLRVPALLPIVERVTRPISAENIGKWRGAFGAEDLKSVEPLVSSAFERFKTICADVPTPTAA